MAHFTTAGERYPQGTQLAEFSPLDVTITPGSGGSSGTQVTQTAPRHLTDGATTYDFLFWDTGRRITGRHTVRWTFNHSDNWSTWNAVAWYGIPGGTDGRPAELFDAYWVGSGPLPATPVDAPASGFVNGPGAGQTAYPGDGNDHEVRTEWGSNRVETLDTMRRSAGDPTLQFSGIQKIVYGGDPSEAVFDENDDDITSSTTAVWGVVNTTAADLVLQTGESGLALVGYVVPAPSTMHFSFVEQLVDLIHRLDFINPGDPSPEDRLRLKLVAEAMELVAGERLPASDAFAGLLDAAQQMDRNELTQTIAGTRATLARGEAALKSMEALSARVTQ